MNKGIKVLLTSTLVFWSNFGFWLKTREISEQKTNKKWRKSFGSLAVVQHRSTPEKSVKSE